MKTNKAPLEKIIKKMTKRQQAVYDLENPDNKKVEKKSIAVYLPVEHIDIINLFLIPGVITQSSFVAGLVEDFVTKCGIFGVKKIKKIVKKN